MSDKELINTYRTWIDAMTKELREHQSQVKYLVSEIERYKTYVKELEEDLQ